MSDMTECMLCRPRQCSCTQQQLLLLLLLLHAALTCNGRPARPVQRCQEGALALNRNAGVLVVEGREELAAGCVVRAARNANRALQQSHHAHAADSKHTMSAR